MLPTAQLMRAKCRWHLSEGKGCERQQASRTDSVSRGRLWCRVNFDEKGFMDAYTKMSLNRKN